MFKPHDTKKLKESSAITISIDFPTNKRNYVKNTLFKLGSSTHGFGIR